MHVSDDACTAPALHVRWGNSHQCTWRTGLVLRRKVRSGHSVQKSASATSTRRTRSITVSADRSEYARMHLQPAQACKHELELIVTSRSGMQALQLDVSAIASVSLAGQYGKAAPVGVILLDQHLQLLLGVDVDAAWVQRPS